MDFLARLSPAEREQLLLRAETIHLTRGEALMRRGEEGGDVFRLESGTLEVLDTRSSPAIVLDTLVPGTIVGEMAFLDRSPRTADVHAAEDCVCLKWSRESLARMTEEEPELGRSLYRALAVLVVERSRQTSRLSAAGALTSSSGTLSAEAEARRIATAVRSELMDAEPQFRRDAETARARIFRALHALEGELAQACTQRGAEEREALGRALGHELHPYMIRSHLAELSIDRPSGFSEDPLALQHLFHGEPTGDGELGEVIDAWLLDRPTARAMRSTIDRAGRALEALLDEDSRVLLVNAARTPLVARLQPALRSTRVRLTLVEGDQGLLASSLRQLGVLPEGAVRPVRVDLVKTVLGAARTHLPLHDLVVVTGLFDYLPDRGAAALLAQLSRWLGPGGQLLLTALRPSEDDPIFRYLLGWPLVRRRSDALNGLLRRSGLVLPPPAEIQRIIPRAGPDPGLLRLARWQGAA